MVGLRGEKVIEPPVSLRSPDSTRFTLPPLLLSNTISVTVLVEALLPQTLAVRLFAAPSVTDELSVGEEPTVWLTFEIVAPPSTSPPPAKFSVKFAYSVGMTPEYG